MRGSLTIESQKIAKEFLGKELQTFELRLFPYIDYCLKYDSKIHCDKVNDEEISFIYELEKNGHLNIIECFPAYMKFKCTKNFYDFLQEILWETYIEKF